MRHKFKKILINMHLYPVVNFLRECYRNFSKNKVLKKYLLSQNDCNSSEKILLLMGTTYGNLGDQAITFAEEQFLFKRFPNYKIIKVNSNMLSPSCGKILSRFQNSYKVAIITGGGFLGTIWIQNEKQAISIIRNITKIPVIIFPQSFFYEKTKYGDKILGIAKESYLKHPNLTIFVRDSSFEFALKNFASANTKIYSVPDMVLTLNFYSSKSKRNGILLCFRNDKEKVVNDSDVSSLIEILKNSNLSFRLTDTVIAKSVNDENREQLLNEKFSEFRNASLVLTDRLHGMIFCAITGTPCIALNNVSKKIQGVKELWLKNFSFIKLFNSINDIRQDDLALQMRLGNQYYDPLVFENYWEQIVSVLKEII